MKLIGIILAAMTAMIGFEIHGQLFWAIWDFFFAPFVWVKWLVLHEVNLTIIKAAFASFLS